VKPAIQLVIFGSLRKEIGALHDDPILLSLDGPTPLLQVLTQQHIPVDMVQLAMVNHRAVSRESIINPGDRLALFPREYAVFADWNAFRFQYLRSGGKASESSFRNGRVTVRS